MRFLEIAVTAVFATHCTYWLIHKKNWNAVRASGFLTLIFVAIGYWPALDFLVPLQKVFFGGTFVAMSEPHRLSEPKVLLASGVFALIFYGLETSGAFQYQGGMGGSLGASAFTACLLVYALQALINYLTNLRKT